MSTPIQQANNSKLPPLTFDPDFATTAELAAYYRECHLQVVPAWMPGEPKDGGSWKRPYLKAWARLEDELVEVTVFRSWYDPKSGKYAGRQNLGLITGRCSWNVFVIDLDIYKHPEAMQWWRRLLELHNNGLEIETVEQTTGGGGIQMLFRAPPGVLVPTGKTAIGVDIRGQGAFAMLPGSRHESGKDYAWKPGRAPWETGIAKAEGWLIDEIKALLALPAGNATPSRSNGASPAPGTVLDAFHHVVDGREEVMRDMVWRAVLEWYRESPIKPHASAWLERARLAYEAYEARVTVQDTRSTLPKREQLDLEGRGPAEWWRKWQAAMAKWGTQEFQDEARKPPPEDEDEFGTRASAPPHAAAKQATAAAPIPLIDAFPIAEKLIPVRNWSVPGLLLKRSLSVLVAPPGSGKSLLSLQLTIAVAVGMAWGGWTPRRAEKVLVINAEDDLDEMRRRLCAAARSMGVDQERLVGRIYLAEAPQSVVIARFDNRTKSVVRMPLIEELVTTIEQNGIGVVVADPFAETIELDENSNSEMKWGAILWREVARRTGTALLLVHHTKKYAGAMAGEADASRGGGALIGTARILVTLFGMTEEEAAALNIAVDDRTDYLRLDDAKANYSKLERARWFRKETVTLGNATAFIEGDDVGVLVPWEPPATLDGISTDLLNKVLEMIDRGVPAEDGVVAGQLYSASSTAGDRWAGNLLRDHLGVSEKNAKKLIRAWLENGTLREVDFMDPVRRRPRKGLRAPQQNRPGQAEKFG